MYNLLRCFPGEIYTIRSPRDILIHSDGSVHDETFCKAWPGRRVMRLENVGVADIGMAIYDCLDYGVGQEEQRTLCERLEQIIDMMVSAETEEEEADEGLGEEVGVRRSGVIEDVLEKCREHLDVPSQAETHYKAVCRWEILSLSLCLTVTLSLCLSVSLSLYLTVPLPLCLSVSSHGMYPGLWWLRPWRSPSSWRGWPRTTEM